MFQEYDAPARRSSHRASSVRSSASLSHDDQPPLDQFYTKRGVRPHVISRLTTYVPTHKAEPKECYICMEALQAGKVAEVMQLPCQHEFCADCISKWLKEHHTCPVCRWAFPEQHTQLLHVR